MLYGEFKGWSSLQYSSLSLFLKTKNEAEAPFLILK
jgi:hypothetical protein